MHSYINILGAIGATAALVFVVSIGIVIVYGLAKTIHDIGKDI